MLKNKYLINIFIQENVWMESFSDFLVKHAKDFKWIVMFVSSFYNQARYIYLHRCHQVCSRFLKLYSLILIWLTMSFT